MRPLSDVLYNFHWIIAGEAARSSQAYAGFLAPFLRKHNIRSVINLRGHNPGFSWWQYETAVCKKLGIEHFDIKLNSRTLPSPELLMELLAAFEVSAKPVLLKCSGGQDRTSFAAALYCIHRDGWSAIDSALAQFSRWPHLHWPKRHQRWIREFLPYALTDANGEPVLGYIRTRYSPEAFMAWLDDHGLEDSFRNLPGQPPRKLSARI